MINEFEHLYWPQAVVGLDEAGRGPLCGPLCVGAVILPPFYENEAINDSKKLSAKKRELLYDQIMKDAVFAKVRFVYPDEIDRLNIYAATKKAMEELAMEAEASVVLSDAMPLAIPKTVHSIIKGDALSISIAAASILAKVSRDRYMEELDKLYPQYGYAKHKGYPTKMHLEKMRELGVNELYRRSYAPVKKILEEGK